MNPPIYFIRQFFRLLPNNLPTLLICLAAVVIVLSKRRQLSRAFLWALSGFSLAAFLHLLIPFGWAYVMRYPSHHLEMCLRILCYILSAAGYGLLLIALCARRSQTSELMPQAGKE